MDITKTNTDDTLVEAFEQWKALLIEGSDCTDPAAAKLEKVILDTPARGMQGVAVKVAYALSYSFNVGDIEGKFGLFAPDRDQDYHFRCITRLAHDVKRLTGIDVSPAWRSLSDGRVTGGMRSLLN